MDKLSIYEQVLNDSFEKMKDSFKTDISNEDFNWDLLIQMLIIEDSPLTELFGDSTIQFAELYSTAKHLATVAHDIENHDHEIIDKAVKKLITQADIDAAERLADEFADFKSVGDNDE